jgi:hypothetical protein
MRCVGFELTIPASERAKTVHALERSATVTGAKYITSISLKRFTLTKLPWQRSQLLLDRSPFFSLNTEQQLALVTYVLEKKYIVAQ